MVSLSSKDLADEACKINRFLTISLLGLALMVGGMACAPTFIGPTAPSGYQFSLQAYPSQIWLPNQLYTYRQHFPTQATLTVEVQTAQGQPVDGVPVVFSLPSDWRPHASITPQRVITRNGKAQAVFKATTTGAVKVTAHVENKTQEAFIAISTPNEIKRDETIWFGVSPRWARVSFLLDDIHYFQVMYLYEAGQPVIASDIESP